MPGRRFVGFGNLEAISLVMIPSPERRTFREKNLALTALRTDDSNAAIVDAIGRSCMRLYLKD